VYYHLYSNSCLIRIDRLYEQLAAITTSCGSDDHGASATNCAKADPTDNPNAKFIADKAATCQSEQKINVTRAKKATVIGFVLYFVRASVSRAQPSPKCGDNRVDLSLVGMLQ
jgi:hypothetical protein